MSLFEFYCNASVSIHFEMQWPPLTYQGSEGPEPVGPTYYVQVAVIAMSFVCSMLGLILDVVFICRKKTNFLVRLFVYLMVATSFEIGSACLYGTFFICQGGQPDPYMYTNLDFVIAVYCVGVEAAIASTINVTLMINLYTYTCGSSSNTCASCWRNRMNSYLKCVEAIFVTFLFGFPVLIPIVNNFNNLIILCIFVVTFIPVLPNLLCNVVLLIWFCWLRRRRVARVRTSTVLKEMALFYLLLFTTILVWAFMFLSTLSDTMLILLLLTVLSVFIGILPYLLLLYMWLSFRSSPRQVRIARDENRNVHINPGTTGPGLETAPESTRVSLPSDTAEHAPNFLSPSGDETSEITPLLNNN